MNLSELASYLSDLFSIVAGVWMLIQGWMFILEKHDYDRRKKSLQALRLQNDRYILNFSGHPMTENSACVDEWLQGRTVFTVSPNVNQGMKIDSKKDYVREVERMIDAIPNEVRSHLSRGAAVVVALPGMSTLAQILLVRLHALQGVFPMVTFAIRDEQQNQFVWQTPFDLQMMRSEYRHQRVTALDEME